jgi:hypothetical protein
LDNPFTLFREKPPMTKIQDLKKCPLYFLRRRLFGASSYTDPYSPNDLKVLMSEIEFALGSG